MNNKTFSHNTYTNNTDYYDLQAEQDSLMLLKSQNNKIKKLYEEISRRETSITSLKEQMSSFENNNKHFENEKSIQGQREKIFRDQINLLENQLHQLEINDREKDKISKDNIDKFIRQESELVRIIESKDKLLDLKDLEIEKLKENSQNKSKDLQVLKENNNEILQKLYLIENQLQIEKTTNENNKKIQKDLNNSESKMNQLIEIVQTQALELQELSNSLTEEIENNKKIKRENNNLKSEVDSLLIKIDTLMENIENLNYIQQNLQNKEKENEKLKKQLNEEREKNNTLHSKLENIEKDTISLKDIVDNKETISTSIVQKNMELDKQNHELIIRINKLEYDIESKSNSELNYFEDLRLFSEMIANSINDIKSYIETYLSNIYYFSSNSSNSMNSLIKNASNHLKVMFKNKIFEDYLNTLQINNLCDSLSQSSNKIKDEIAYIEKEREALNNDNITLSEKLNYSKNEISNLKSEIIENIDTISLLNSTVNTLKQEIDLLEDSKQETKDSLENKIKNIINCFVNLDEEMRLTIESLESSNTNLLNNHNINFADLKSIFKFNFNKKDKFDYEAFKNNQLTFFSFFKSLCEEYVLCLMRNNELTEIKNEVEIIREDFYNNKRQMIKENQDLVNKNIELERKYEEEFGDELIKFKQEMKEIVDNLNKELKEKSNDIENYIGEIQILHNQIEIYDNRVNSLINNKKDNENEYNVIVNQLRKELEAVVKANERLEAEIDIIKLTNEEKDKVIYTLRSQI